MSEATKRSLPCARGKVFREKLPDVESGGVLVGLEVLLGTNLLSISITSSEMAAVLKECAGLCRR